jgi:hypothetical protein
MQSEMHDLKERLTVERRAQQHLKPASAESGVATWTHLRRRLSRAEHEARAARHLSFVLFGLNVAAVAGAVILSRQPSAAVAGTRTAGASTIQIGDSQSPLPLDLASAETAPSPLFGMSDHAHSLPVLTTVNTSTARIKAASPTPAAGHLVPTQADQSQSTSFARGGASHESEAGAEASHSPGTAVASAMPKPEVPVAAAPSQSVATKRSRLQRHGRDLRRAGRSSVRGRTSGPGRSRRRSRTLASGRYWRVYRVSRAGADRYCLVDPQGNWWRARRVQTRSERRGDLGK